MKLLLAAGGTGGHVYPALATADEARRRGHAVVLLGQADGIEARLASEADVPFHGVRAGKWDRQRPDPRQAWSALAGLAAAVRFARRWRPDLVAGFGGFASFPGCAAAMLLRRPLLLHEGNAFPGRVTRWFARWARGVAAAQPEVADRLPRARRVEAVGFPVRERRVPRDEARRALGLPRDGVLTLVMGGSQGSAALNESVPAAYRALEEAARPLVLHASGPRWADALAQRVGDLSGYRVAGWVDATLAWSAADLAVTRAGVGTLSEAAFHGVPLVMVPLPSAAEDHQRHNARALQAAGAGRCVVQGDAAALAEGWRALLAADARRAASRAIAARSPEGAARRLVDLAERLAGPLEADPRIHPSGGPPS